MQKKKTFINTLISNYDIILMHVNHYTESKFI